MWFDKTNKNTDHHHMQPEIGAGGAVLPQALQTPSSRADFQQDMLNISFC